MKLAGELSDGRVKLATGTLYTALDRLTAEGHVELVSEETAWDQAARRAAERASLTARCWTTDAGQQMLDNRCWTTDAGQQMLDNKRAARAQVARARPDLVSGTG